VVAVNSNGAGAEEGTAPPDEIGFVRKRDTGASLGPDGCGDIAAGKSGREDGSVTGKGVTKCRGKISGTAVCADRDDAVPVGRQIDFFGDLKGTFVQCPDVFVAATVDGFGDLHCFCYDLVVRGQIGCPGVSVSSSLTISKGNMISIMDTDMIILDCPVCGEETDFEILKEPPEAVVRCTECGHTMRVTLKEPKIFTIKTIVSYGTESHTGTIELMEGDICSVGDFLVAEVGDESYSVEVMSIERDNARRTKLPVEKIEVLWTRLVDKVIIRASLNKGAVTIPLYEQVPGDKVYTVDHITSVGGKQFRITRIKLRKGNIIQRKDKTAQAHEIKRIYGERS